MALSACTKHSVLDINELLDFTDCSVFSKDGYEFKLHRIILAKASEVFKAMLSNNMNEGITRKIKLEESVEVLTDLFCLIYSGSLKQEPHDFYGLLLAANKYLIVDIEKACMEKLKKSLNTEKVVEILIFSHDKEFATYLRDIALDYIACNIKSVRNSDNWSQLHKYPHLMDSIIDNLANPIARHGNKRFKSQSLNHTRLSHEWILK